MPIISWLSKNKKVSYFCSKKLTILLHLAFDDEFGVILTGLDLISGVFDHCHEVYQVHILRLYLFDKFNQFLGFILLL